MQWNKKFAYMNTFLDRLNQYVFLESVKFIRNERVQETQQNSRTAARNNTTGAEIPETSQTATKKLPQRMTASV